MLASRLYSPFLGTYKGVVLVLVAIIFIIIHMLVSVVGAGVRYFVVKSGFVTVEISRSSNKMKLVHLGSDVASITLFSLLRMAMWIGRWSLEVCRD